MVTETNDKFAVHFHGIIALKHTSPLLSNLPDLSSLDLINPSTNLDALLNLLRLQIRNVILHGLVQIRERKEVKVGHLLGDLLALVLFDDSTGILVFESQHAAASVLDDKDLSRAKQLLGDDKRAEGILGGSSSVANDVGSTERDTKRSGRVDAGIHASHCTFVS